MFIIFENSSFKVSKKSFILFIISIFGKIDFLIIAIIYAKS